MICDRQSRHPVLYIFIIHRGDCDCKKSSGPKHGCFIKLGSFSVQEFLPFDVSESCEDLKLDYFIFGAKTKVTACHRGVI